MQKEKKKGFFSTLFGTKKTSKESNPSQTPSQPAKNDSFADINDLIPSPQIVYQKPVAPPIVEKKKKNEDELDVDELYAKIDKTKKPKKAAPPPPQERGIDVGDLSGPKKPPRDPKELSVEEKKAIIRKQLNEDQEEKMSSRKSSASSGSRVVETNVLHYSPQTQHRVSAPSPIPISEVPVIERQSNIILNGTQRVKSIPVSQYDGRPKQAAPPPPPAPLIVQVEKIVAPPIPSSPAAPPPVASPGVGSYHKKSTSLDSTMPRSNGVPKLDAPPTRPHYRPPPPPVEEPRPKTKEEEDLEKRYENIKAKYDMWQLYKNDEKHSKEAKRLQMELISDHDNLLKLVKGTNNEADIPSPGQKKRPSIAPDTYTPRLNNNVRSPLTITPTYNSSNSISSSPNSSSPGTSRSVTPKNIVSSPSVSPAASVDSSDSGVVRGKGGRSDYAVPKIEPKKTEKSAPPVDENANLLAKRIIKPRDSIELQKQNAINRINDEVREQRRKEQEVRRYSQPIMSLNAEEDHPRLEAKAPLITNGTSNGEKVPPQANGITAKTAKAPAPVVESPTKAPPKPQASVSRIMVNVSPPPQRATIIQSPAKVASPVTQKVNGKTLVTVNNNNSKSTPIKQEKIYSTPKPSKASESPKTPPLPNTPHPKLPYMNRATSADEAEVIYKVSTVKKTIPPPIKEENNNRISSPSPKATTKEPKRSPVIEKKPRASRNTTREIPVPVLEQKTEVTSAIKTTIATSRVERVEAKVEVSTKTVEVKKEVKEIKPIVKESTEKGSISRNIADTLAKHNNQPRPALDLSAMLDRSTLRKVAPPVERNGIALGRVVDAPQPSTSITFIPPPPPPPPPMMAFIPQPPPPPPPPADLLVTPIYQVPSPIVRPSSIPVAPPPPLVTSSQLTDQKQRLRTPVYAEKPSSPLDLRDSLMAEIRNAGGGRGLRKVNRN